MLTFNQQQLALAIVSNGGHAELAAAAIGVSIGEFAAAASGDAEFACELRKATALAEFAHLKNIHAAREDVKNWRASVWWLEQQNPQRYAPRSGVPAKAVDELLANVARIIAETILDDDQRAGVLSQLSELSRSGGGLSDADFARPQITDHTYFDG